MAWASLGSLGFNADATPGTSLNTATTSTALVGQIILPRLAFDNIQTTDGVSSDLVSVTDDAGNQYSIIAQHTNGNGSAGAGATIACAITQVTKQLNSGANIIFTFNGSTTAKGWVHGWFSLGAGKTWQLAQAVQRDVGDLADPAAQSISGLPLGEYLFDHSIAWEGSNVDSYTGSVGYEAFGLSVLGGPSMSILQEARIATLTGDSVNVASNTSDQDYAQIYYALQEISAGGLLLMNAGS